ncbi:hypothetical protein IKT18_03825 [Candidatus Saccharibacteria bacterium]|nr:hypothetical protein [Candidatus Saccharibacteria bacterium]
MVGKKIYNTFYMVIFEYKVSPAWGVIDDVTFCVTVTDDLRNNVVTRFREKEYIYTISQDDIEFIKRIIRETPGVFEVSESLEPNDVLDGEMYSFVFSDGKRSNSFCGFNILDYGRKPRKNATMALRLAREINQTVFSQNDIRTRIPSKLQHWLKYEKREPEIKI